MSLSTMLRVGANRLALRLSDLQDWHAREVLSLREGFRQYAPSPFAMSPLLETPDQAHSHQHYLCASPPVFIGAITHMVREAASRVGGQMGAPVASAYGYALEDYVEMVCRHHLALGQVFRVSKWEEPSVKQADLLLVSKQCGLLIEIKRSLASSTAKEILDTEGCLAVADKIGGAYRQCANTARSRPWRSDLGELTEVAAIILVDEAIAGDAGAVALLLDALGPVVPYFEVMSVSEFEDMLPVLGVESSVRLIRQKWISGKCDVPLRVFAAKERGRVRIEVADAKAYLRGEDAELLVGVGLEGRGFAARWP